MSNSHSEKFLTKLLFGFACVIGGIFFILFAAFDRAKYDDWYPWAIVASVLICVGLYLLLSAFVHKVKSDFIRRQADKEKQRSAKS